MMTGSGSAVFGVFARAEDAQAAYGHLRSRWERTWLCATCRESLVFPTWIETPRLIITDFTPDMARALPGEGKMVLLLNDLTDNY